MNNYETIIINNNIAMLLKEKDIYNKMIQLITKELNVKKQGKEITIIENKGIKKYYKHITNEELSILKSRRFLVNYSYSVMEYSYLYLCIIDNVRYTLILNNKRVINTFIYFKNVELYENGGTLFEGKIINNYFIINDLYNNETKDISNLLLKINILHNIFYMDYIYDELKDNYRLVCENFVDYQYIKSYYESPQIKELKPYIKGLIFRDINPIDNINNIYMNYLFNMKDSNIRDLKLDTYIKVEEPKIETINIDDKIDKILILKIIKTNEADIYNVFYQNKFVNIADVPDLKTSIYLNKTFKKENKSFLYFKCRYNINTKRWRPFELNLILKK
jgi:hypothetical protein